MKYIHLHPFILCYFLFPISLLANEIKVEAESFTEMQGIVLENNGFTIGHFDDGDWLKYENINFDLDFNSIRFHLAKANTGGKIEIRIDNLDGQLIGAIYPTKTPGWFAYEIQPINILEVTGQHDLFLIAKDIPSVCNLDYFILSQEQLYEPNWVLAWQDEFNEDDLNEQYWTKIDDGNPFNNELQFYSPRQENIEVSNGTLKLIARKETYTGQGPNMNAPVTRDYTSGKIETQGKINFKYGRIEARIKLPRGKGTWPAFWLLGSNYPSVGWPRSGEIDIMEHYQENDYISAAVHTETYNFWIGTHKVEVYNLDSYDSAFHVYGLIWDTNQMTFSVDGDPYFTLTKTAMGNSIEEWPFDQPFFLILNQAVGGISGGTPDDSLYPHTVEVDWVRVYEDQQITSINQNLIRESFNIFPNPTSDKIFIQSNNYSWSDFKVSLFSISGQAIPIHLDAIENQSLDLSFLDSGLYFLNLSHAKDGQISFRIIKN